MPSPAGRHQKEVVNLKEKEKHIYCPFTNFSLFVVFFVTAVLWMMSIVIY